MKNCRRPENPDCGSLVRTGLLSSEAIAAIYRTIAARLKRDLAGLSAFRTHRVVHLAGSGGVAAGASLTGGTAGFAALRFIREAFFCIKFLLTGSEDEFLSAFLADQGFVVVHEIPL